jgi:thioredoxin reductase (NADPH)
MKKPVLLVADNDQTNLETVGHELATRYGAHYSVRLESSSDRALHALRQSADAGDDVALVLAEQRLPGLSGAEFLAAAHQVHPHARRALLIQWGEERQSSDALIKACMLGSSNHYIARPVQSPDERFHRAIAEFLDEWWRDRGTNFEMVRIIGEALSARSHEIRDLLTRADVPFGFYATESKVASIALAEAGVGTERLPVVMTLEGTVLIDPSNRDVAAALGVRTTPNSGTYDVTIVGGGPAGLAASVYAGSEGLRTLLLEPNALGGQAGTSSLIRNYLGFPRGISGNELARRAVDQARLFGADIVYGIAATSLRAQGDIRVVGLSDGTEVESRAVVIATGVSYRRLDVPELESLLGAGVFYGAAVAEAQALRGEQVFVIGGGNSAGQAAAHLARYASTVTVLVRSASLAESMSEYLINEIAGTPNIDVRYGVDVVGGGGGTGGLEQLELRDRESGVVETVPARAVFVLIGASPCTAWLSDAVAADPWGYLLTGARCGIATCGCHPDPSSSGETTWREHRPPLLLETSIPGVFAVGDVRHGSVKRVASGVGEGAICIQLVHEYLGL